MQVVVKAESVALETGIECAFSRVAEGRVPDIVRERQRLGQIHVQTQCGCNLAYHLCDFYRVGETAAEVVGRAGGEHLRLACKPAKRARLHHTITVPFKRRAPIARRRRIGAYSEPMLFGAEDAAGVEIKFH